MDDDAGHPDHSSNIPIHWQHRRYESYASANFTQPAPIILEDRTEQPLECSSPLWAKDVQIDSYVVVSGQTLSFGDYIVWNCQIATLDVSDFDLNLNWNISLESLLSILNLALGRSHCHQEEVDS